MYKKIFVGIVALSLLMVVAACSDGSRFVEIYSVAGMVRMTQDTEMDVSARAGVRLHYGSTVSTGADSRCDMRLDCNSLVVMDQNSQVEITLASRDLLAISVLSGSLAADVVPQGRNQDIEVRLGNSTLSIRGTYFTAEHREDGAIMFTMFEGAAMVDGVELPRRHKMYVWDYYGAVPDDPETYDLLPFDWYDASLFVLGLIVEDIDRFIENEIITPDEVDDVIALYEMRRGGQDYTAAHEPGPPEEPVVPWHGVEYIIIRGIQFSTNLTDLSLVDLGLEDYEIVPLRYMTSLDSLDLSHNQISDLAPLAELTNLRMLGLSHNQISDIIPLTGLTNLTYLGLFNNHVSDIAPVADLINLTLLNIHDNGYISDITPLAGLTAMRYLRFAGNNVTDIAPLAGLTDLWHLGLGGSVINDFSPLYGLSDLTELHMYTMELDSVALSSLLSNLPGLTGLRLIRNQIDPVELLHVLSDFPHLTSLWLRAHQLTDIQILSSFTNLTWLHLESNQISDITPLAGLTNLTQLNLDRNQVSDIQPLSGLVNLAELSIYDNPITDWTPVAHVTEVIGRP